MQQTANKTRNRNTSKPKIIAVLGPTAVGKSDLAVILAKQLDGEIVSADSRQVYQGLNIGTGKITKKEMLGIPHYLLDIVPLKSLKKGNFETAFSVSDFQLMANEAIADILSRGKVPIICGGTGFYIQSIIDGIILPDVPPNPALRKEISDKTAEELFTMLKKIDPKRAKTIDAKNPARLVRAIEIAKALGRTPPIKSKPLYDACQIGIDIQDDVLKEKIRIRLEKRMSAGMPREVRKLHEQGVSWKRMYELGLEYRYLSLFLQKKITRAELTEQLSAEIWQYAKRQRTWFKRDERINWFSPYSITDRKLIKKISGIARDFLKIRSEK